MALFGLHRITFLQANGAFLAVFRYLQLLWDALVRESVAKATVESATSVVREWHQSASEQTLYRSWARVPWLHTIIHHVQVSIRSSARSPSSRERKSLSITSWKTLKWSSFPTRWSRKRTLTVYWRAMTYHRRRFCFALLIREDTRLSYNIGRSARLLSVLSVNRRMDRGLERLRHKLGWVRKPTKRSNFSMWAFALRCSCVEL